MSDWREVWHVWDGDCENAPSVFTGVFLRNGILTNGSNLKHLDRYDFAHLDEDDEDRDTDIVAYTTGKKRRRVECGRCKGDGIVFEPIEDSEFFLGDCPACDGKGNIWEVEGVL